MKHCVLYGGLIPSRIQLRMLFLDRTSTIWLMFITIRLSCAVGDVKISRNLFSLVSISMHTCSLYVLLKKKWKSDIVTVTRFVTNWSIIHDYSVLWTQLSYSYIVVSLHVSWVECCEIQSKNGLFLLCASRLCIHPTLRISGLTAEEVKGDLVAVLSTIL